MARFTKNAWDNIHINHALNVCSKKGVKGWDWMIRRCFWQKANEENKKINNWNLK